MPKRTQMPIQFDTHTLTRLRRKSEDSGRSLAALVREAVDQYLDPLPATQIAPEALWSILCDPQHWQIFKSIVAQHEPIIPCDSPLAQSHESTPEPQPTWRHQRGPDAKPRARPPHEKPPF